MCLFNGFSGSAFELFLVWQTRWDWQLQAHCLKSRLLVDFQLDFSLVAWCGSTMCRRKKDEAIAVVWAEKNVLTIFGKTCRKRAQWQRIHDCNESSCPKANSSPFLCCIWIVLRCLLPHISYIEVLWWHLHARTVCTVAAVCPPMTEWRTPRACRVQAQIE